MKLNELKRIAEERGCSVSEVGECTDITYGGMMVATVENRVPYVLNTEFAAVFDYYDKLKPVIVAAVEFAMTPIEDRKEDGLFYVRYPSIPGVDNMDDLVYVNYNHIYNKYEFATWFQHGEYQTQFTPKEIESMPESIRQAIQKGVLEVIEVSEVDD